MTQVAESGWFTDPVKRHVYRYWDGVPVPAPSLVTSDDATKLRRGCGSGSEHSAR